MLARIDPEYPDGTWLTNSVIASLVRTIFGVLVYFTLAGELGRLRIFIPKVGLRRASGSGLIKNNAGRLFLLITKAWDWQSLFKKEKDMSEVKQNGALRPSSPRPELRVINSKESIADGTKTVHQRAT